MQRLAPVVWAKGTFLNPQHLQVQDRYLEALLQFRTNGLIFAPWGFLSLRLDQEALAAGGVALSEGSGIMPEGLPFDFPRSDPPPEMRRFAEKMENGSEVLDIYLAVPEYHEGQANIAQHAKNGHARYTAEAKLVCDEFNAASEKHVMVARKNFRLLLGDESQEGYSAMPVARVERLQSGLFRLQPQFVPPMLDFRASDFLNSIGRRLLEILSGKSMSLSGSRRQRNQSLADFTASEIPRFWLLYSVNTFLPAFRHLIDTRGGHPERLYAAMLELAGCLTAFSDKVQPADLPLYNHQDLGACFTALDQKLRLLLETSVPDNYLSVQLRPVGRSILAGSVDRDDYFVGTRMYLAFQADINRAELLARIPQLVKVGSADVVDHLVQRALPGIQLRHVPDPPSVIPVQFDFVYYSLDQTGPEFEGVKKARNIAAYVPAEIQNARVELIIVLNATTRDAVPRKA